MDLFRHTKATNIFEYDVCLIMVGGCLKRSDRLSFHYREHFPFTVYQEYLLLLLSLSDTLQYTLYRSGCHCSEAFQLIISSPRRNIDVCSAL